MKCKCIELSDISEYEDNDSCKAKYTIMQLQQENKRLKDNLNKLNEIIRKKQDYYKHFKDNRYRKFLSELLDKMQELEKRNNDE